MEPRDMDKYAPLNMASRPRPASRSSLRRSRLKYVAVLGVLSVLLFWHLGALPSLASPFQRPIYDWKTASDDEDGKSKVQLEAHIMSKCPDARDCLADLVVPAMAQVSPKVNFTLSFIGTPTDPEDGVECKHGPTECLGNIIMLCAAHLYPDPKLYLGFANCLDQQYDLIPQEGLVRNCALEHGISFEKLNYCASRDDGYGVDLLRQSVTRSRDAGVKISCTVRLEGKTRCVMDGGRWKDCSNGSSVESLVRDVEALWKKRNQLA